MRRLYYFAILCLAVMGCALPPEQVPLKPLPEDGPAQPYADLITRARVQATAANEAFYANQWSDIEDAARGLEQTARHIGKAADVPLKHKDTLATETGDLSKEASSLQQAAKSHDPMQTTDALQKINLQVRALRPDNP